MKNSVVGMTTLFFIRGSRDSSGTSGTSGTSATRGLGDYFTSAPLAL